MARGPLGARLVSAEVSRPLRIRHAEEIGEQSKGPYHDHGVARHAREVTRRLFILIPERFAMAEVLSERMNVVRIEVSNFKGVEYAVLPLEEHTTVIGGKNHQGKTSAIDALLVAIAGKRAFPVDPIRDGEMQAEIIVTLDGATELLPWPCTVTRTITRTDDGRGYTTEVKIVADDGQPSGSPQTLLSSLTKNIWGIF